MYGVSYLSRSFGQLLNRKSMIKNLIPPYTPGTREKEGKGGKSQRIIFCPSITTHSGLAPKSVTTQTGKAALRVCLTDHEAHEFVRQDAGADEGHPQADVKLPGALRLHPHKQADKGKQTQTSVKRALVEDNDPLFCPYFLIFSNTSAILPKRF